MARSTRVTTSAILQVACPAEAAVAVTFSATATTTVPYTGTDSRVRVGALVTGTNWTNGTTITAVNPGVSFTTSAAPGASVTAATVIDVTVTAGTTNSPTSVVLRNADATATNTVLIGGRDLSSSNGLTIPGAGGSAALDLINDQVFVLAGTGTPVVEVLRLN